MIWAAFLLMLALATGCTHPHQIPTMAATPSARQPAQAPDVPPSATDFAREWIDLEPGWRLRVTTPVTYSGKVALEQLPEISVERGDEKTGQVTLRAPDLAGYEIAMYSIDARQGAGFVCGSWKSAGFKPQVLEHRWIPLSGCCHKLCRSFVCCI